MSHPSNVPTEDQSSIYAIFVRLNTGGVNLQPQEIRVALYHGELLGVLNDLNEDQAWRKLFGPKSKRLKDVELILRFFAFLYYAKSYAAPMKLFLNRYMAANRHLRKQPEKELRDIFSRTASTILEGIGARAFRPRRAVNAAAVDSIMTGVAKRLLARGAIKDTAALNASYDALMGDDVHRQAIETSTAQEANVNARQTKAEAAFSLVP